MAGSSSSSGSSSSLIPVAATSIATNFLFYADYFAYIAESGLNRARAMHPGIAVSTQVDLSTILNKPSTDVATANFTRAFDTSYEYLWLDGQNIDPIRTAFEGLSQYVLKSTNQDINTFIEAQGIKVLTLYATLANIFGETIENENTRTI